MSLVIYNASILRGRWSGVEWAVWQRAVELASGKSPDEFVFLVADGVALPSPLPGGCIVRLPRFVGTRLGRIFHELFLMPRLVRSIVRERGTGNGERGRQSLISLLSSFIGYLLSPISYLLSAPKAPAKNRAPPHSSPRPTSPPRAFPAPSPSASTTSTSSPTRSSARSRTACTIGGGCPAQSGAQKR